MNYNTSRNYLSMKEYGRHIQRMVEYVLTIEDKDKRNQQAKIIIELMGVLNPHLKNVEDFRHMLWDHLFFISDFKLDVDSPYPIPEKTTYKAKTQPMGYPKRHPRFSHLGKNLELVIDKALQENDPEKKAAFANSIAYYMKLSYSNWHKELVHDETIRTELDSITGGQLEFSNTPYIKHRPAQPERTDYGGRRQQNFGGRNNRSADNRGGNNGGVRNNNNRSNDGRVAGNRNGDNRNGDNRSGGLRNNNNPPNRNFKKRF